VRDDLAEHQGQILRGRNGQVNESRGVGGITLTDYSPYGCAPIGFYLFL
jgi:hypothetical protein